MVIMVPPCKSTVFPFVINKSRGGLGIFFKRLLSDSGVSPGMRQRMAEIHQDG